MEDAAVLAEEWRAGGGSIGKAVDDLLAEARLPPAPRPWPPSHAKLARIIHQAMIENQRRLANRMHGHTRFTLNPQFAGLSAATDLQPVANQALTLSQLIERYESDPARPKPTGKTRLKVDAQYALIREVIGADTLLTALDGEKTRTLLDTVAALPPNATKRFPKLSAQKVVQLAKERQLKPMSAVTANAYLSAFATLMDFAVKEELIARNPAAGLRLAGDGVRRKDKRLPFTVTDLKRIFAAPLYTGCLDDEMGYARHGPNRPRRGRFWVPIIALFTGMRLNEACQLTEDDIAVDDDTDIILIRSDEDGLKRVKTTAGHRFVPIHPELKRIGFLDHVAAVRRSSAAGARWSYVCDFDLSG